MRGLLSVLPILTMGISQHHFLELGSSRISWPFRINLYSGNRWQAISRQITLEMASSIQSKFTVWGKLEGSGDLVAFYN